MSVTEVRGSSLGFQKYFGDPTTCPSLGFEHFGEQIRKLRERDSPQRLFETGLPLPQSHAGIARSHSPGVRRQNLREHVRVRLERRAFSVLRLFRACQSQRDSHVIGVLVHGPYRGQAVRRAVGCFDRVAVYRVHEFDLAAVVGPVSPFPRVRAPYVFPECALCFQAPLCVW